MADSSLTYSMITKAINSSQTCHGIAKRAFAENKGANKAHETIAFLIGMIGLYLDKYQAEELEPIAGFIKLEEELIGHRALLPQAKIEIRSLFDEARAELVRQHITLPERNEASWRPKETHQQRVRLSYEQGKGYSRDGD